jgi:hypothetical protein
VGRFGLRVDLPGEVRKLLTLDTWRFAQDFVFLFLDFITTGESYSLVFSKEVLLVVMPKIHF